jgi:hypothetical protein
VVSKTVAPRGGKKFAGLEDVKGDLSVAVENLSVCVFVCVCV